MAAPLSRRTFLTTGAAAAGALLPGVTAYAGRHPNDGVRFTLNAEVLDGGEQVTSITLHTARLGRIDPASLTTGTFSVHAKATSPIPIAAGDLIFSEYDLDRPVTAVRLDRWGNIVLDLSYGEGQVGGGTLGYILSKGRNVMLDLVYTITQNTPIALRNRRSITIARFVQGRLSDPEVDAFSYHVSRSGMKYRLYSPSHGRRSHAAGRGRDPLVVWLHGGGEGASLPDNYYDNETTLRANRGALGFATRQAQRIFDGAYVVAPQSTSRWLDDGPGFAPLIREIIGDLVRRYPIDRERIYVAGCQQRRLHDLGDDFDLPSPLRCVRADLCRCPVPRAGRPTDAHRRPAEGDRHPDVARRLAGRPGRAGGAQHHPRPRAHSRLLDDPVRPRHLERPPVQRPLVVDLCRPQRPDHRRNAHLAVDGRATR